MAIIKHLASRNSHYEDARNYLEYEHDERGKIVTDINGDPVKRKDVIIDAINCNVASFDAECEEVNRLYKKNNGKNDIKQHHYIISFDPRDAVDNGLTPEQVQAFGMEFANKYLPGYQTLVCTHVDGHNGSGNLHCHITINSIRIFDVEQETYMTRFSENLSGIKHRATDEFMDYIKARVMEMCQERGLYQANLLEPAAERITDREYYARLRGLQLEGASFQTKKDFLRDAIRYSATHSGSLNDFKKIMRDEFNVAVKESRGRFSYITSDRERGITDRQLGSSYTLSFVNKVIKKEAAYISNEVIKEYRTSDYIPVSVRKLIDIANNEKAKISKGYEHALIISNLKQSANTINLFSEMGIKGQKELLSAISNVSGQLNKYSAEIKTLEANISEIEDIITFKADIERIEPIIRTLKTGKQSVQFRKEHESDLIIYKAAKESLKSIEPELKELSAAKLKEKVNVLRKRKNELYEQRSLVKKDLKDLENAKHNIERMTGREINREKNEIIR